MNLTLSDCKELKYNLSSDWRDAATKIGDDEDDFVIGNYRFIHIEAIDEIMAKELEADAYLLGCFKAEFIASVTNWPMLLIEAAQKGEAFEEIGDAIIDGGFVSDLAAAYAEADGYGHHFSSYDGETLELGSDYYMFRIN